MSCSSSTDTGKDTNLLNTIHFTRYEEQRHKCCFKHPHNFAVIVVLQKVKILLIAAAASLSDYQRRVNACPYGRQSSTQPWNTDVSRLLTAKMHVRDIHNLRVALIETQIGRNTLHGIFTQNNLKIIQGHFLYSILNSLQYPSRQ